MQNRRMTLVSNGGARRQASEPLPNSHSRCPRCNEVILPALGVRSNTLVTFSSAVLVALRPPPSDHTAVFYTSPVLRKANA